VSRRLPCWIGIHQWSRVGFIPLYSLKRKLVGRWWIEACVYCGGMRQCSYYEWNEPVEEQ
jgi:hypothetical protein